MKPPLQIYCKSSKEKNKKKKKIVGATKRQKQEGTRKSMEGVRKWMEEREVSHEVGTTKKLARWCSCGYK
jgi:hypothetical protein